MRIVVSVTDVAAELCLITVIGSRDLGPRPVPGAAAVSGTIHEMLLTSAAPDHRPCVTIALADDDHDPPLPWSPDSFVGQQDLLIDAGTITVATFDLGVVVEAPMPSGRYTAKIHRIGAGEIERIYCTDPMDVFDTVGVEQWLLLLSLVDPALAGATGLAQASSSTTPMTGSGFM
ncbi:MAG: hypothetical protein JXA67_08115 [Micromonosporaceae bacterium]|nr:hypothetical protein [Micromonosporaceae bacterium]